MIPDKEAKHLTYKLLQESFLHMYELKKSISVGPVKNFYLFHINFNQVHNSKKLIIFHNPSPLLL